MSKWCGDENCLQCVDKEPDPYVHLPREEYNTLRDERDHAKKMEAVQKEVADNQTWHVRELRTALSKLQALVLALPVVGGDIELDIYGYVWAGRVEVCKFDNTGDAKSYADLLAYRATLDATTPAGGQG